MIIFLPVVFLAPPVMVFVDWPVLEAAEAGLAEEGAEVAAGGAAPLGFSGRLSLVFSSRDVIVFFEDG